MSDKPLADRLQVKGTRRLAVIDAPAGLDAADRRAEPAQAEVVLLFTPGRRELDAALPPLLATMRQDAILWIAYSKLTSRLARDLSRDVLHGVAPGVGLDPVAQIAVDDDWSALRMKRIA